MENNTALLIAAISLIGSFLTVVITSLMTVWGKAIDAKQKSNEHKLSIRSAYVIKKIDAGQAFIVRNNILIHKTYLEVAYFTHMKKGVSPDRDFIERIKFARNHTSTSLENNDYVEAFFDIESFINEMVILVDKASDKAMDIRVTMYWLSEYCGRQVILDYCACFTFPLFQHG